MKNSDRKIKLVAFDLDGTLLNSKRELSPVTHDALIRAAAAGVELVPTTGRYFNAMPNSVKALCSGPDACVHYAITINGAEVRDLRQDKAIARETFDLDQALALMRFFDLYAVEGKLIYDCYMDNTGWINRDFYDNTAKILPNIDAALLTLIQTSRNPVPDLKTWLAGRAAQGHEVQVQKVQCFIPDLNVKSELFQRLPVEFPDLVFSTSSKYNIEVNSERAQKGIALATLAAHLGLTMSQTMAIGDDINDTSMIQAAGIGVAMGNAKPEIKAIAKKITLTNDENGVAAMLSEILADCD